MQQAPHTIQDHDGVENLGEFQRCVARGSPVIMTGPLRRPLEFAA